MQLEKRDNTKHVDDVACNICLFLPRSPRPRWAVWPFADSGIRVIESKHSIEIGQARMTYLECERSYRRAEERRRRRFNVDRVLALNNPRTDVRRRRGRFNVGRVPLLNIPPACCRLDDIQV